MFSRQIRHIHRYRELANILAKNGFGWFIQEIGLANFLDLSKRNIFMKDKNVNLSIYERLRKVIQELGPTYVKMGQIASTRPDLLPQKLINELIKLQDQVPPFDFKDAKEIIEQELKNNLDDLFNHFDSTPIAAASIGQIHKAVLKSGEKVAVKIQRPGIQSTIETDLEILNRLALLTEKHFEWARHYEISEIVQEFAKSLRRELDYRIEAKNADRFIKMYKKDPYIKIPKVYWEYTTAKVLVLEYIEAVKLNSIIKSKPPEFDRRLLAERITRALFSQLLDYGFFHADPHPGNLFVLPGNIIVFLDFGMIGRLSGDMQDNFALLVIGMMRRNTDIVIKAISRMGLVPEDVNDVELHKDIDEIREKYYDVALSQVNLGIAINDIFAVAFKHRIKMPADLTLVGKALITLEGVVEQLDPKFSVIQVAKPFGKKLLRKRLHPQYVLGKLSRQAEIYGDLIFELPKLLKKLTRLINSGKLTIQVEIHEVDELMQKLDRISNRISFSIILLAFCIFVVGVMISSTLAREAPLFGNLPVLEIGFLLTTGIFLWLLWSIFRSGRL